MSPGARDKRETYNKVHGTSTNVSFSQSDAKQKVRNKYHIFISQSESESESVPAQEIIVYFKAGVTYEETRLVHELTNLNPNLNLIIGSDCVSNSSSYLAKLFDDTNEPAEEKQTKGPNVLS